MHGNHLKQMLISGGVALAVLVLLRVPLGQALPLAAALACPLMMIFMMRSMAGQTGHGGCGHAGHGASGRDDADAGRDDAAGTPESPDAGAVAGGDLPPAVRR